MKFLEFRRNHRKMFFRHLFGRLSVLQKNYCQNSVTNALAHKKREPKSLRKFVRIHCEDNGSLVVIQFVYANDAVKVSKSIKCVRKSHESIGFSIERVRAKIVRLLAPKCAKRGLSVPDCKVELDGAKAEHDTWTKLLDNFSGDETNLYMKIDNELYPIEYNSPSIPLIELPTEVYSGFDCCPSNLNLTGDFSKCTRTFEWKQKSPRSDKWIPCKNSESFIYRVSENDIGTELQLTSYLKDESGVVVAEQKSNVARVSDQAPNTEAIERRHEYTTHPLPDHQFRIVTYNLLADFYAITDHARTKMFPYCSPSILAIGFRKLLFIRELLGYHCDVMCLQEVDESTFEHDFGDAFGRAHFKGFHAKKSPLPEGLATFYNSNKFSLISDHCIVLSEALKVDPIHHALYQRIQNNAELSERMLRLGNTVQILVLHCKSVDKYLVVANTHLYSPPNAGHIRLLQVAIILNQLRSVVDMTILEHNTDKHQVSAVLCGDFNCIPSDPIHQMVTQGNVQYNVPNSIVGYYRSSFDFLMSGGIYGNLSDPFRFCSAYDNTMPTLFTQDWEDCVDYTYYSSNQLRLIQTVPLPSKDELSEHIAIPSIKYPSDHLALVSDFEWSES